MLDEIVSELELADRCRSDAALARRLAPNLSGEDRERFLRAAEELEREAATHRKRARLAAEKAARSRQPDSDGRALLAEVNRLIVEALKSMAKRTP